MASQTNTLTEGPLAKQIFLVSLPLALSTLLQVLCGMLSPDRGSVKVWGKKLRPGSIQAAVPADDFVFIAVFNGTDDQRGKNTILPDTFRKSSHLLVVLYLVGMAFKRAQLVNS